MTEPPESHGTGDLRPRVLVVDDHVPSCRLVTLMASQHVEVDSAEDGATALHLLAENRYDAILLDLKMPLPMTGIHTLREIRSRYPDLEVRVIAFTAHVLPGDEQHLHDEGFDGYLAKPFVRADLLDVLRQHIDGLE